MICKDGRIHQKPDGSGSGSDLDFLADPVPDPDPDLLLISQSMDFFAALFCVPGL